MNALTRQRKQKPGAGHRLGLALALCGPLLGGVADAQADSVILPRGAESAPGSFALVANHRFQEIINPEELAPHMPNGAWITGISFRPEGVPGTLSFDLVEVRLSTTSRRADGLSRDLSANTGPDETLVFRSESVRWVFTTGVGVRPFQAAIPFMTPYLYLPGQGSLLLDVRLVNPSLNTVFDAHDDPGDGISRVLQQADREPGFLDTRAPVVRIDFTAVPEPSIIALLGVGAALLTALHRPQKGGLNHE